MSYCKLFGERIVKRKKTLLISLQSNKIIKLWPQLINGLILLMNSSETILTIICCKERPKSLNPYNYKYLKEIFEWKWAQKRVDHGDGQTW